MKICSVCLRLNLCFRFKKKLVAYGMSRFELETRKKILHVWYTEKGVTYNQIAQRAKVHQTSMKNKHDKFGPELTLNDLPRSGRQPGPS